MVLLNFTEFDLTSHVLNITAKNSCVISNYKSQPVSKCNELPVLPFLLWPVNAHFSCTTISWKPPLGRSICELFHADLLQGNEILLLLSLTIGEVQKGSGLNKTVQEKIMIKLGFRWCTGCWPKKYTLSPSIPSWCPEKMQDISALWVRYSPWAHWWMTFPGVPCDTLLERGPPETSDPNNSQNIKKLNFQLIYSCCLADIIWNGHCTYPIVCSHRSLQ